MDSKVLDWGGSCLAREAALSRFAELNAKYSELRAWIVASSPTGQVDLDASIEKIAEEFPAMLIDAEAKTTLLEMIRARPPREAPYEATARWRQKLMTTAELLEFDGSLQVEIRFHALIYELVAKLQLDPLVDRERTPQTRASIRIVLGTLIGFAGVESRDLPGGSTATYFVALKS